MFHKKGKNWRAFRTTSFYWSRVWMDLTILHSGPSSLWYTLEGKQTGDVLYVVIVTFWL
jgi:hypothetical protein